MAMGVQLFPGCFICDITALGLIKWLHTLAISEYGNGSSHNVRMLIFKLFIIACYRILHMYIVSVVYRISICLAPYTIFERA